MVFQLKLKWAAVAAAATPALLFRAADAACAGRTEAPLISYSQSSERIYVDKGCATMADIYAKRSDKMGSKGPLYYFDEATNSKVITYTGVYYMEEIIHIRNGATLEINGASGEFPCKKLLLASNKDYVKSDSRHIRAHGGKLVIKNTKIVSHDIYTGTFDMDPTDGRAYVSAITEFITGRAIDTCPGDEKKGTAGYSAGSATANMGVATMDIYDSELAYLGYEASESYGVSYKARGLCKTLENLDIFDDDQDFPVYGTYAVYGDIYRSDLHHNWFGHYSYGHQGGKWIDNTVHDNFGYGFDPHDDSDHLVIKGNTVYNNGWHGIIASKRCTDITISDNVVYNNKKNGIMLHRSCDHATVTGNHAYDNGDAGLSLYESSDCRVANNHFENNPRGLRLSQGANRNNIYRNKITMSADEKNKYGLYLYAGNDKPLAPGNTNGHPKDNNIYENEIVSERSRVWTVRDADNNAFYRNKFTGGNLAEFFDSTNNLVQDDMYLDPNFSFTSSNSCFATNTDIPGVPLCEGGMTIDTMTAPPTPTPGQECENGIPGIQVKEVCCPNSCGQCGGAGCTGKPGAPGFSSYESCCGSGVRSLGRVCSDTVEAPCVFVAPTPAPIVEEVCENGIPGIQVKEVCCPNSCGQCGGAGCTEKPGAPGFSGYQSCCGSGVRSLGRVCSDTVSAPCVFAAPTPAPIMAEGTCKGGIPGIQAKDVCCPLSCTECGGEGCSARQGDLGFSGGESCCGSGVKSLNRYCGPDVGAPCIVVDGPTPEPVTPPPAPVMEEECENGIPGIQVKEVCCPNSCGQCGGAGCTGKPGAPGFSSYESCCGSGVRSLGRVCSGTVSAPCVFASSFTTAPTPAPTPAPVRAEGTCDGGIPGFQSKDVCCPTSCGSCGGANCSKNDGGEFGGSACCESGVKELSRVCSDTVGAPCFFSSGPTPGPAEPPVAAPTAPVAPTVAPVATPVSAPVGPEGTCDGGIPGIQSKDVCCPLSCTQCGGSGCGMQDGGEFGGSAACCESGVRGLTRVCSDAVGAPCVISSA